jgi:ribosomal protein L16 Arg81 hydroxylase
MFNFSISKDDFHKEIYEKKFYLERSAFSSDFTWDHLNDLLHTMQPMSGYARLHNGSQFIPESEYTETHSHVGLRCQRFLRDPIYNHLRSGSTLILDRLEVFSAKIKQYCDFFSRFTDQPVVANGYAAFGKKESFGRHWDTHDVFAVQLIGRKRWQVYAPTHELPMPEQTSQAFKRDCPREPTLDIYLHSGDILYVPRGWWHTAIPDNDETFHIAVGVHPARLAHYAAWICQSMLSQHLCARQSISNHQDETKYLEEIVTCFSHLALNRENLSNFKRTLGDFNAIEPQFSLPLKTSPS